MKTPTPFCAPRIPLAIISCVALALAACDQKSASADPAKERQLQDMQAKLDQLSAQSTELNRQMAEREATDTETRQRELKKAQADLEDQRAVLESERNAFAASDKKKPVYVRTESTSTQEDSEPVYQGKPATYEVFYSKLQDDGAWIESDDYGYIWRPRVAEDNRRWKPYTDGHWVQTDRGWTWESNERFGWATYHYGRWVNLNDTGWCWVPGDEWAPAWVSWRSSDRYVGWAPLPPEARLQRGGTITASIDVGYNTGPEFYNFVDTQDFGEETYVGRVVEPERNVTIINQSVNVTNITYTEQNIYNYGPDVEDVRHRSRRPVDHYQLELNRDPRFDRNSAVARASGDHLRMVAPLFAAVSQRGGNNDVRPAQVERKVVKVERDNGWRGVRPEQREAVKADLQKKADSQAQTQQAERERQRSLKTRNDARQARQSQAQSPATTPAAQPTLTPMATPAPTATPAGTPRTSPDRSPSAEQQKVRREAQGRHEAEQGTQTTSSATATPEGNPTPDATPQRPEPSATPVEKPTSPATPKLERTPADTLPNVTPARPIQAKRPQPHEQQKARREANSVESPKAAEDVSRPVPTPLIRQTAPADVPNAETPRPQRQPQVQQAKPLVRPTAPADIPAVETPRPQVQLADPDTHRQQVLQAKEQALRERRQEAAQQKQPVEREVTRTRQAAPEAGNQQQPDATRERTAKSARPAPKQHQATRENSAEAIASPTPQ